MQALAFVLVGLGGFGIVASIYAERYHSHRFETHTDTLEAHYEADDRDAMSEEVKRFHEDRRVDWAIWAMFWGNVVGMVLLGIGLFLLLRD